MLVVDRLEVVASCWMKTMVLGVQVVDPLAVVAICWVEKAMRYALVVDHQAMAAICLVEHVQVVDLVAMEALQVCSPGGPPRGSP